MGSSGLISKKVILITSFSSFESEVEFEIYAAGWDVLSISPKRVIDETYHFLPDVVLLDLDPHEHETVHILNSLRASYTVPIIVLSPSHDENTVVESLRAGAFDYIRKPYYREEMLLRLQKSISYSRTGHSDKALVFGDLSVSLIDRRVRVGEKLLNLSKTEFSLLKLFVLNPELTLSYDQILGKIWGEKSVRHIQYVRAYVCMLRKKIEIDPDHPRYILTDSGTGYRFIGSTC